MILFIQLPFLFPCIEENRNICLKNKCFVIADSENTPVLFPSVCAYRRGFRRGGRLEGISSDAVIRVRPDIVLYKRTKADILSILNSFSPLVESKDNGFYMDISGNRPEYGSIFGIADKIHNKVFSSFKTHIFIGAGSNKLICRMASDLMLARLMSGFLHVPGHSEKEFLRDVPLSLFPGIEKDMIDLLSLMDINTAGELNGLALSFLKHLFSFRGVSLFYSARGKADNTLNYVSPERKLIKELYFSSTNNIKTIKSHIYTMIESICHDLRTMNKKSDKLLIEIGFEDSKHIRRYIKTNTLSFLETDFYEKAVLWLDHADIRRVNCEYVCMEARNIVPASKQGVLYIPPASSKEKLLNVVYEIRKKYGRDKLGFKYFV